jgi:hypothetical protein
MSLDLFKDYPKRLLKRGKRLFENDAVRCVLQSDNGFLAYVEDHGSEEIVCFFDSAQGLEPYCTCGHSKCAHQVAAALEYDEIKTNHLEMDYVSSYERLGMMVSHYHYLFKEELESIMNQQADVFEVYASMQPALFSFLDGEISGMIASGFTGMSVIGICEVFGSLIPADFAAMFHAEDEIDVQYMEIIVHDFLPYIHQVLSAVPKEERENVVSEIFYSMYELVTNDTCLMSLTQYFCFQSDEDYKEILLSYVYHELFEESDESLIDDFDKSESVSYLYFCLLEVGGYSQERILRDANAIYAMPGTRAYLSDLFARNMQKDKLKTVLLDSKIYDDPESDDAAAFSNKLADFYLEEGLKEDYYEEVLWQLKTFVQSDTSLIEQLMYNYPEAHIPFEEDLYDLLECESCQAIRYELACYSQDANTFIERILDGSQWQFQLLVMRSLSEEDPSFAKKVALEYLAQTAQKSRNAKEYDLLVDMCGYLSKQLDMEKDIENLMDCWKVKFKRRRRMQESISLASFDFSYDFISEELEDFSEYQISHLLDLYQAYMDNPAAFDY